MSSKNFEKEYDKGDGRLEWLHRFLTSFTLQRF